MKLHQETSEIQEALGKYCKTGIETQIPGITPGRVHHYRRLTYNVVKNTMVQAYPICLQVMGAREFEVLVHRFFAENDCKTPRIWRLPEEFYNWAVNEKLSEKLLLPWLNDLLLFEWIEIDVHTMEDIPLPDFKPITDMYGDHLVINPEYKIIQISYPVHLYVVKDTVQKKGRYFVMISRHPDTGKVYFFNLSVFHIWLIEQIRERTVSIEELLPEITMNFGIDSERVLRESLSSFLKDMINKKVILGKK